MSAYTGVCSCGAVEVEVIGEPAVMAVCHCTICRGWSAAPVTGACLWTPENVKVTKAKNFLAAMQRYRAMTENGVSNAADMFLLITAQHTG